MCNYDISMKDSIDNKVIVVSLSERNFTFLLKSCFPKVENEALYPSVLYKHLSLQWNKIRI